MYILELSDGTCREFPEVNISEKKIVICVAKNEDEIIKEWVEHYLSLGFDSIIIGDNNDEDTLFSILSEYIDSERVYLFNLSGLHNFQCNFYNMFSERGEYDWALFVDCDEYLYLDNNFSIGQLVQKLPRMPIAFNWLSVWNGGRFISNKTEWLKTPPKPVLPITLNLDNFFIKLFLPGGKNYTFLTPHQVDSETLLGGGTEKIKCGSSIEMCLKYGWIWHYSWQSAEDSIKKMERGYPDTEIIDFRRAMDGILTHSHSVNIPMYSAYYSLSGVDMIKKNKFIGFICSGKVESYFVTQSAFIAKNFSDKEVFLTGIGDRAFNMIKEIEFANQNNVHFHYVDTEDEVINLTEWYFTY